MKAQLRWIPHEENCRCAHKTAWQCRTSMVPIQGPIASKEDYGGCQYPRPKKYFESDHLVNEDFSELMGNETLRSVNAKLYSHELPELAVEPLARCLLYGSFELRSWLCPEAEKTWFE
eukprot:6479784-Amphidinium_carterae.2